MLLGYLRPERFQIKMGQSGAAVGVQGRTRSSFGVEIQRALLGGGVLVVLRYARTRSLRNGYVRNDGA